MANTALPRGAYPQLGRRPSHRAIARPHLPQTSSGKTAAAPCSRRG